MTSYSKIEKRNMIMHAYLKPLYKKTLNDFDVFISSSRCLDNLKLKIDFKNDKLHSIFFDANGCAIFLASCEIVINEVVGKSIDYTKRFLKQYYAAINHKNYDKSILKKAQIFDNVKKHLNRLECAKLIYDGISKILL